MATVFDVAQYILTQCGAMSTMKLQKLVYYSQAWSLVWDERPLFAEPIQAWAGGPVSPDLFNEHRGQFHVAACARGNPANLTASEIETVNAVLRFYGDKTGAWLSDLTHQEAPWLNARSDLPEGARGNALITPAAMYEYYSGLRH